MTETNQTEDETPAIEAPQDVAQTIYTKAEAAGTTTDSDELSEDDLEAVAGGTGTSKSPADLAAAYANREANRSNMGG